MGTAASWGCPGSGEGTYRFSHPLLHPWVRDTETCLHREAAAKVWDCRGKLVLVASSGWNLDN